MPDAHVTNTITVTTELWELHKRYASAKKAAARWKQEQESLKGAITEALGYDPEDPSPQPVTVVDLGGNELFSTKVGTWRGLGTKYLKERYPHIYAECEQSKPTLTIKYAEE